ncbi:hypothetical protein [Clostridium paridis]|uniref:Glycine zipper family protein n=1 Tax=Clostridium paridis TaxID=2803863 RepID=A0A937K2U1_9CLOT|nr:hypothetical protein [Clostridium paridis]MBL4930972.1 hypothetical protein [Clostridium paridis]
MSAFVLNRNYELQLPNSYEDIDCDEMEYVDGGSTVNVYLKGTTFKYIIIGGSAAIGTLVGTIFGQMEGGILGCFLGGLIGTVISNYVCRNIDDNKYYNVGSIYIPFRQSNIYL